MPNKLLYYAHGINNIRKMLGWRKWLLAIAQQHPTFKIVDTPPQAKVLVLSPHPDDEIFGCGGTLALHRKQGDTVKIIYLCSGDQLTNPTAKVGLAQTRHAEALKAIKRINLTSNDVTFLDNHDNDLTIDKNTVVAITKIINEYAPTLIYLPHPADNHPDHEATARILYTVLSKNIAPALTKKIALWHYEVWQPIFANRLINIDKVLALKKQMIADHHTQLQDRPYDKAIIGLNTYRGGMFGIGPAEGFLALPASQVKLFN